MGTRVRHDRGTTPAGVWAGRRAPAGRVDRGAARRLDEFHRRCDGRLGRARLAHQADGRKSPLRRRSHLRLRRGRQSGPDRRLRREQAGRRAGRRDRLLCRRRRHRGSAARRRAQSRRHWLRHGRPGARSRRSRAIEPAGLCDGREPEFSRQARARLRRPADRLRRPRGCDRRRDRRRSRRRRRGAARAPRRNPHQSRAGQGGGSRAAGASARGSERTSGRRRGAPARQRENERAV